MSVVCADCSTENRDAAKFCKSCGAKLIVLRAPSIAPVPPADTAWPVTAPAPLARTPELPAGLFDPSVPAPAPQMPARAALPAEEATVIVGAAARVQPPKPPKPPPAPVQPAVTRKPPPHVSKGLAATPKSSGKGLRIGIVALAVLVGAGGWYLLRDGNPAPVVAAAPPTVVAAAPAPAPVTEPAAVAPATAPEPPAPPPVVATPAPTPAPVDAVAPARPPVVAAAPKPRKVPVAAPPAAPAETAAPAVPAPPPAAPPPPANPQTACAGRNFVALAQCMASQCAKAEFKATAQCDAVRAQQRLEEEKRNPSLLN
ncbi:zinc ribbon domain-containing protein [Variovorax fucosicus]|uniref:zinc ribbon domain-containing protein n=1 Tax=Variovorax fucosicus TaxID=3053517 RepID=UPI0025782882|nr:zinc ribbon domain-containing protein [Variovorax sp. J22G47]MDM0055087.1 zinc ribbon domain-containing protein [Variovorax sp. J22G47]